MGLLDKVKSKLGDRSSSDGAASAKLLPPPPSSIPLGPESVIRYRKQRGVNLGGSSEVLSNDQPGIAEVLGHTTAWFSLEKWIAAAPFEKSKGRAESDVSCWSVPPPPGALAI